MCDNTADKNWKDAVKDIDWGEIEKWRLKVVRMWGCLAFSMWRIENLQKEELREGDFQIGNNGGVKKNPIPDTVFTESTTEIIPVAIHPSHRVSEKTRELHFFVLFGIAGRINPKS